MKFDTTKTGNHDSVGATRRVALGRRKACPYPTTIVIIKTHRVCVNGLQEPVCAAATRCFSSALR